MNFLKYAKKKGRKNGPRFCETCDGAWRKQPWMIMAMVAWNQERWIFKLRILSI
jgi:hypothetical protein